MRRITRTLVAVVAVLVLVSGMSTAAISLIDGFEDGDISEYSGDTADATVVTSPVYEGDEALQISSGNGGVGSTSGLPDYPERGDTFRYRIQHDSAVATNSVTGFAMQSEGNPGSAGSTQGYLVVIEGQNDVFELWLDDFETVLVSENVTIPQDEWLEVVVTWGNPTITVTLYDSAGTQLAQIQVDDSTYNTGGVAMGAQGMGSNTAFWDNLALGTPDTPTLTTATATSTPTDGNQTASPVVDGKKDPGEIWESFLVFVGFITMFFAGLAGLASRSMAVGATAAYVAFGYLAISTGHVLLTNILYVSLVVVIIGMALKMWRMEFGGEI